MGKLTFLKLLDLFSDPVKLNINGKAAHQTYFGVIFTVIYCGIMVAVITTQGLDFFDTKNPITVTENYLTNHYPEINIWENELNPIVVGWKDADKLLNSTELQKYFTFRIQKLYWVPTDKSTVGELKLERYSMKDCSALSQEEWDKYDYLKSDSNVLDLVTKNGICLDIPRNLSVKSKVSDKDYTSYSLEVYPCVLGSECKPLEDIRKANIQIFMPTTNFNSSNYSSPIQRVASGDEVYYAHPGLQQTYTVKIGQQKIIDQEGFFSTHRDKAMTAEVSLLLSTTRYRHDRITCLPEDVENWGSPNCQPYLEYVLMSSGIVKVNKRTYPKITDKLGAIGGTNTILFIILVLIYAPINNRQRRNYILKEVYPLLGEKDVELKKKKTVVEDEVSKKKDCDHKKTEADEVLKPSNFGRKETRLQTGILNSVNLITSFLKKSNLISTEESESISKKVDSSSPQETKDPVPTFCCKKKKSPEDQEYEQRLEDAYQRIEQSLDVMTMLRCFNLVIVLSHLMFDARHFDLAQYVGFYLWRKEKREKIEKAEEIKNSIGDLSGLPPHVIALKKSLAKLQAEKDRVDNGLEFFQSHHEVAFEDFKGLNPKVKNWIDAFYFLKLLGNAPEDQKNLEGSLPQDSALREFVTLENRGIPLSGFSVTQNLITKHQDPVKQKEEQPPVQKNSEINPGTDVQSILNRLF